jgi:ABC-type multidrug transport system ATPase subunit
MIALRSLTKRYGGHTAVDDLTFDVLPGTVTGFLGPNGAGKSTTMRMILGLDRPDRGSALIRGRRYADLRYPLHEVGGLLEANGVHPGRTGRAHLVSMARSNGIATRRVDAVLATVGLTEKAGTRAGTYSLGMMQRLGIAGVLLGDPGVLLLDEPVNGLDPDGVRWIRELMRSLAGEGRTVFVSSHLMSEMQQTADHVVVINKGRLIADTTVDDVIGGRSSVLVRSPEPAALAVLREHLGASVAVEPAGVDGVRITGVSTEEVGDLAYRLGIRLHELSPGRASLEEAYMELVR